MNTTEFRAIGELRNWVPTTRPGTNPCTCYDQSAVSSAADVMTNHQIRPERRSIVRRLAILVKRQLSEKEPARTNLDTWRAARARPLDRASGRDSATKRRSLPKPFGRAKQAGFRQPCINSRNSLERACALARCDAPGQKLQFWRMRASPSGPDYLRRGGAISVFDKRQNSTSHFSRHTSDAALQSPTHLISAARIENCWLAAPKSPLVS
jgi:hypothetical protein